MPTAKTPNNKGKKLEYTFKSDVLFKMLFINHQSLLKRLVAALLSIPTGSITNLTVINADIPPEEVGKKFCRLDINMDVDGQKVNLELQNRDEGNYPERTMFYWARIFASSLPNGNNYAKLPHTIIISIIDFKMFDCEEVHSEFQVLEVKRHEALSGKQVYHFFELKKLKDIDHLDLNNERDLWLALFNAETEDELTKLVSNGGKIMSQAIEAYRGVTATEEFRSLEWLRRKTEYDEAQAIYNAERREREKWQSVVADRDATLADRDATLADKDIALADKDALIAELQAKLGIRT